MLALRAAAAEAEKARWQCVRENMTPKEVSASKAAAAVGKKVKRKRNREDMIAEEREMVLAIRAYEKRTRYQLRDDAISLQMEELLRDCPMYTANDLARAQEANDEKMQAV